MSIRYKTLILVGSIFIVLLAVLFLAGRMVVLNSFLSLEKADTLMQVQRSLSAFNGMLAAIGNTAGDWASRDDTYRFLQARDKEFIANNLTESAVSLLQLNFMVFINREDKPVYSKAVDLTTKKEITLSESLLEKILASPQLMRHPQAANSKTGILMAPSGPVLVCSRPVLRSDNSGPAMGVLVVGRYLDHKTIEDLSAVTHHSISIYSLDQIKDISVWHKLLLQEIETKQAMRYEVLSPTRAAGYALLRNLEGLPALLLKLEFERVIFQEGRKAIQYALVFILIIGAVFIAIIMGSLEKAILDPLSRLRNEVDQIGRSRQPGQRVPVQRRDELGDLAVQINRMLEQLQTNEMELAESNARLNRDIQERIKAEKALRESEERFREMAESLPEAIFEMNLEGRITFANRKAFDYFGFSQEDYLRGVYALDSLSPPDRQRAKEIIDRILAGEKFGLNEYQAVRKDGSLFPALFHTDVVIRNDKPAGMRGFFIDITENKRIEAQLKQSQRLESIGTLAGGIAHDFNNILMGIQGCISLLLTETNPAHPHFEYLINMETYVQSAANLTRQLLGFARGGKYQVKTVDFNELIKRNAAMFGRTKKEIMIHGRYQKEAWRVEADRGQMDQVLLNLLVNASQAMPGGGNIYIETANVCLDERQVMPYSLKPGRFMMVSVTDTGVGIDEKLLDRIFDPFFTTKEMGRGTGLGLASAYGIIKSHGGFINAFSEKGMGSTFIFYLPASDKEIVDLHTGEDRVQRGNETLLLVDDEQVVLKVGKMMLEKLGYRVFCANSGQDALKLYREHRDQIGLVLLDIIMPEMGGEQVFRLLKKENPRVDVLLITGYSLHARAAEMIQEGCKGLLEKPFKLQEVSQKIREVLDCKDNG